MENIVDSDVVDENNSHSISIDDNQNSDQESATELKDGLSLDMNCPSGTSMQNEACAYTKAERFTSEVFKIEIGNLPKFFGYGECKKFLTKKLKLKPHKIKVIIPIRKAYVTFKNEEDKVEAVDKLKEYKYKGNELEVKNAKPKVDAMATKRHLSKDSSDSPTKKQKTSNESLTKEEVLKNSVIPWWTKTYEEQLKEKQNSIGQSLVDLRKKLGAIHNLNKQIFRWIMQLKKESGQCCPTKSILPSPITAGYRNKCGFTVGRNLNGEIDVGFRLGKYRNQTCAVEPPTCLVHVSDLMKEIASSFAEYVRKSKLAIYNQQDHQGHWKQLVLRTSRSGMVMATIALCKQNLSEEDVQAELQSVKNHFISNGINIDSLLFRVITDASVSNIESTPAVVFDGEGVIYESLLELKFRVSPDAFFQCNTLGAEVLYDCVKKMVRKKVVNKTEFSDFEENKDIVLLDVCCGTGTIGLCLAKHVRKVIGIDLCKEAIEDAKINAKLNGITNAEYRCNKAEEELPDLVRRLSQTAKSVVAVVDPPRSGLHHKVIKAIRQCNVIEKLVYVSCKIDQAKQNFIDLCRPASKRIQGLPFIPILAQPIDLFPHTAHCELVVLLERIREDGADKTENAVLPQKAFDETGELQTDSKPREIDSSMDSSNHEISQEESSRI